MNIQHKDNGTKGAFYIEKDNVKKAELTYVWTGKTKIIIDHTEVDDSLRGEGIGEKLVRQAVDFAKEKDVSILPLCPFAKAIIDKNKELQDIL
ncbi:GNAT family N-acetyltransferase [Jejudonia soesokkakensis]|uniref:GNAT family N-acetyltransferase n=1 Tax=Jejudonia soesokkakensis TaxID=1323432 RepID=A0ABW2MV51_9FLAO